MSLNACVGVRLRTSGSLCTRPRACISLRMLCYAMLCCAVPCRAVPCYDMIRYAMICCYAMTCYDDICYDTLSSVLVGRVSRSVRLPLSASVHVCLRVFRPATSDNNIIVSHVHNMDQPTLFNKHSEHPRALPPSGLFVLGSISNG